MRAASQFGDFARGFVGSTLTHDTADNLAHVQNTIQFAYELQKAGKPSLLMLYPKSRHGVTDSLLVKHMRQMMTDFIVANL